MQLKQIPEDFIVEELYDIKQFENKEENKPYHYFILTKKEYTMMNALETISRIFKVSRKQIHFAGTKDKNAITKQVMSIRINNEKNLEANINFLNEKINDLNLEYLGKFNGRINLSDNIGNKFIITIRELQKEVIEKAKKNIKKIEKEGIINYFDEQRFGFANNSHIIGKYILKNEPKNAVFEILTSMPKNPSEELETFTKYITKNIDNITQANQEIIDKAIELTPKFFRDGTYMLNHLKKHQNDFPGSFRTLHKKLRTLYINAYQSYIFNETLNYLIKKQKINEITELYLINENYPTIEKNNEILEFVKNKLTEDELTFESFKLPSMPELKNPNTVKRKTKIYPQNINIENNEKDELNENKYKIVISFELEAGDYATNVIKQLFNKI